MLVVKMMSNENLADNNSSKDHVLYTGTRVVFKRVNGAPILDIYKDVVLGDNGTVELCLHDNVPITGNVYVMENGKTIDSYTYGNNRATDNFIGTDGDKPADKVAFIREVEDIVKIDNMIESSKPRSIIINHGIFGDLLPLGYRRDDSDKRFDGSTGYIRATLEAGLVDTVKLDPQ